MKRQMVNVYKDCDDGKSVAVTTKNGYTFYIDKEDEEKVKKHKWYACVDKEKYIYILNRKRLHLYHYLMPKYKGYEIDHIDLDRLNNRKSNLRYCTHQQNQINQPLQKNNTSGYVGVSYYAPRHKFRGRIKICQHEIHLGYYETIIEAVQARNVAMELLFGKYGRYDKLPEIPKWIRKIVEEKCRPYLHLSVA